MCSTTSTHNKGSSNNTLLDGVDALTKRLPKIGNFYLSSRQAPTLNHLNNHD